MACSVRSCGQRSRDGAPEGIRAPSEATAEGDRRPRPVSRWPRQGVFLDSGVKRQKLRPEIPRRGPGGQQGSIRGHGKGGSEASPCPPVATAGRHSGQWREASPTIGSPYFLGVPQTFEGSLKILRFFEILHSLGGSSNFGMCVRTSSCVKVLLSSSCPLRELHVVARNVAVVLVSAARELLAFRCLGVGVNPRGS